jgi:hypothetical protein
MCRCVGGVVGEHAGLAAVVHVDAHLVLQLLRQLAVGREAGSQQCSCDGRALAIALRSLPRRSVHALPLDSGQRRLLSHLERQRRQRSAGSR